MGHNKNLVLPNWSKRNKGIANYCISSFSFFNVAYRFLRRIGRIHTTSVWISRQQKDNATIYHVHNAKTFLTGKLEDYAGFSKPDSK